MIVDDTDDIRSLLRVALNVAGFETIEASEGPAALRMLATGPTPDLVLLDVQMPVMDGWQTLSEIRRSPATATLPVIMCTVKSRAEDRLHGWELGCDGYLSKPFDIRELVEAVRSVAQRPADLRAQARESELAALRESPNGRAH
ncbi:MAG TPA: response regulator transcription factor [Actinomycetota bacterium]|nr:response regulator transcription factor [Actinomycetota bacterium]